MEEEARCNSSDEATVASDNKN